MAALSGVGRAAFLGGLFLPTEAATAAAAASAAALGIWAVSKSSIGSKSALRRRRSEKREVSPGFGCPARETSSSGCSCPGRNWMVPAVFFSPRARAAHQIQQVVADGGVGQLRA